MIFNDIFSKKLSNIEFFVYFKHSNLIILYFFCEKVNLNLNFVIILFLFDEIVIRLWFQEYVNDQSSVITI